MDEIVCAKPDCQHSYRNHKWGKIKANGDGWLIQVDGTSWCPDHIPEWYRYWKSKH